MASAAIAFRFTLATLFMLAGLAKLPRRHELEQAIRRYELVPESYARLIARWLPGFEVGGAILLVLGIETAVTAAILVVCLVLFSVAVTINLLRGRIIDCGCFGPAAPQKITWLSVLRNLLLAGMAFIVVLEVPSALTLVSNFTVGPRAVESTSNSLALVITGTLTAFVLVLVDDARGLAESALHLEQELETA